MYGYGHGSSWAVLIIFVGMFAVRMLASRRRHPVGHRPQPGPPGSPGPAGSSAFVDAGRPDAGQTNGNHRHVEDAGADEAAGPVLGQTAPMQREVTYTGIPAGWFADPSTRHEQRFWSGTEWTEHVTDGGVPGTDPPPIAPGHTSGTPD